MAAAAISAATRDLEPIHREASAIRCYLAAAVVAGVREKEVARAGNGDAKQAIHHGVGGRPALAAVAKDSGARKAGDDAGGVIHAPNARAGVVGDEEIPRRVERETFHAEKHGVGGGNVVSVRAAAASVGSDGGSGG